MAGEATPGKGHNKPPINGDEDKRLKDTLSRVLNVDDEIKELSDAKADIWLELKALGYNVAAAKRAYRWFKMEAEKRRKMMEEDEVLIRALGLDLI